MENPDQLIAEAVSAINAGRTDDAADLVDALASHLQDGGYWPMKRSVVQLLSAVTELLEDEDS